jgi:hypothetical protein
MNGMNKTWKRIGPSRKVGQNACVHVKICNMCLYWIVVTNCVLELEMHVCVHVKICNMWLCWIVVTNCVLELQMLVCVHVKIYNMWLCWIVVTMVVKLVSWLVKSYNFTSQHTYTVWNQVENSKTSKLS